MSEVPDHRTNVSGVLAIVLASVGSLAAMRFDWFERFCMLVRAYDYYQLDEGLISGLFFATAAIFVLLRRERDLRRSMARVTAAKDVAFKAARTDYLTGLPNRLAFTEGFHTGLKPSALLLIDLDGFKNINDSNGHSAGDQVLVEVARRLGEVGVTAGASLVARLGGDEFACLLPHALCTDPKVLAQRIMDAISRPVFTVGGSVRVTASVGIAVSGRGRDLEDMFHSADQAMYAAKNESRDSSVTSPCMIAKADAAVS